MTSLDNDFDNQPADTVATSVQDVKPTEASQKKKDKKKNKLAVSDDLLNSLDLEEGDSGSVDGYSQSNITADENQSKKQKEKQQNKKVNFDNEDVSKGKEVAAHKEAPTIDNKIEDEATEEDALPIDPNALTLEQKARRERPPSRVKFAESSQPGYVMLGLEKVGLMYGNEAILKDATFSVTTGERVGLVGPNGAGKTTQLKILAGLLEPTYGDVVKSSKNLRAAFLRQEFIDELVMTRSLWDELFSSFEEEQQLLKDIAECEAEVEKTTDDPVKMDEVLNKLQKLQDTAISKGVYSLDSKVEKIMNAMGFDIDDAKSPVSSFSGGWKMRIGLAKILLKDPNILLLDEPTNHLDLDSVFWLEDFLQKQNIPMVVVSHDREFLDRVCNKIIDVEEGTTVSYDGNYSKFLEQRRIRLDLWRDKYDKQRRFVQEEEKWIKKAKNDENMAQQVKAKEAQLEKLRNSEEWVEQPPKDKKFRFRFPPSPRCGQAVLEVSKLSHGYGEGKYKTLFQDVDINVDRGDRIGFIGPNGSGKSTMMRIISGEETPKAGYAEFASSNVVINYFQQNQADDLNLEKTVLETVQEVASSDVSFTETRALLGQFMFKGDDVDKRIGVLSGGEKARVALCKMMMNSANVLLLDEPTNHLDIASKEVLEDAILNFEGSVLVISHDRYFMSQIANTIFSFENKSVYRHDCDYHDFMVGRDDGLKEKVVSRYVEGDKYKITNAKEVIIEEPVKSKKNFGGSGVTSGNLFKGIKNAKRFNNN